MKYYRNIFCLCLIAIVPFGYYANDADSSHVRIDGGVGTGQYLAVLRSCNDIRGERLDHFTDIGTDISCRPAIRLPIVFGIRAGYLRANPEKIISAFYPVGDSASIENGYINPYFSIETKYFGIGAGRGWTLGPERPNNWIDLDFDFRQEKDYVSGHLRIGSYSSAYAIMSFYEGTPVASQYGYFLLGAGGSIQQWHLAGGLSGGPYDGAGFYMGVSRDIERYGRPSLSFRAGSTHGVFEGAIGLNWSWPVF